MDIIFRKWAIEEKDSVIKPLNIHSVPNSMFQPITYRGKKYWRHGRGEGESFRAVKKGQGIGRGGFRRLSQMLKKKRKVRESEPHKRELSRG